MKKALITTLQVAVTVFALYWVFRDPETRAGMAIALRQAEVPWLFAALAAGALSPVTASVRLWMLLRVQGLGFSLRKVTQLYMVGMFFNLFLLGSTGGDAVKLFYLLRGSEPKQRAGIILSVIMDRVLGLLALMILAAVFLAARYHWLTRTPAVANVVHGFALILALAVGGLATVFAAIQLRLIDRLPVNFPARTKFIELAGAVAVYTRAWPTTLAGIGISFLGHSSFFFTYYFAARALKAGVAFIDMTVILPIINTIIALPISVSGVGVRESLFKTLLHDLCGVGPEKSVPISIIGFLCTVIFYGLLGGVVYLFFRSVAGAPPSRVEDVEAKMEEAELPGIAAETRRKSG